LIVNVALSVNVPDPLTVIRLYVPTPKPGSGVIFRMSPPAFIKRAPAPVRLIRSLVPGVPAVPK
jgi:hypothetical protein